MLKRLRYTFVIPLFLLAFAITQSYCAALPKARVIVLTLDRLTLDELATERLPHLRQLMNRSTIGLVSLKSVGWPNPGKLYAAIGAGGIIPAGPIVSEAYDPDEFYGKITAREIYQNLNGRIPGKGPIHLGLPKLREDEKKEYAYRCGELGRVLHRYGLKTAVFGNCDVKDALDRSGVAMVMDNHGVVDFGTVGPGALRIDANFPMGIRTDYQRLYQAYQSADVPVDLALFVSGDLERLEDYRQSLSKQAARIARNNAMREWDAFLGQLMREARKSSCYLMVLVPSAPELLVKSGEQMAPFLLSGPGIKKGLAYSYSTRLAGLVTPGDLCATFIDLLGKPVPPTIGGKPIRTVPGGTTQLLKAHQLWAANYTQRWPILTSYAYTMIFICIAGLIAILFLPKKWLLLWICRVLHLLLNIPMAFLLVSIFNPSHVMITALLTITIAFTTAWLVTRWFHSEYQRLTFYALWVVLILIVDLLTGTRLLRYSMLGYSVMVGARYYGLGNEYMGILLGSFLTGIAGLLDLTKGVWRKYLRYITVIAMAVIACLVIHPQIGANIGGGISAVAGFGLALIIFSRRRIQIWEFFAVGGLVVLFLVGVAWIDYISGNGSTHFMQNIRLIKATGPSALAQLISRKWNMNMGLILVTPWARVLIVFMLGLPLLFRRPAGLLKALFQQYPYMPLGLTASITTGVVALLVNDSGIVAAAMLMIYGGLSLFCMVLRERYLRIVELEGAKTAMGGMGLGDQDLSHHRTLHP
jgi:hypothetical protein